MLFQDAFDQFSFQEFYNFIWTLMQKHKLWNILFIPQTNSQMFSSKQLTHAAPQRDISHPDSFIGQWKKNEDKVRRVKFRFTARNGSPDIEMTVDLDDRTISLDNAAGISPKVIRDVLHSSFSHVSDIKQPKVEKKLERNQGRYDGYRILESLPEGGQAWTHIVAKEGDADGKRYVLKVLKNTSEQRRKRFEREINACLVLAHPNIVKVVYHKLDDPRPFLVSEYCEGGALDFDRVSELSLLQKLEMFGKICSAIGFAHDRGIVHRDLKPDNIFLLVDKRTPVIGDFGLCLMVDDERITAQSEAVGPRFYMAPELEDGQYESVSPAADVYSLGKLLYWLLEGRVFAREKQRRTPYDLTAGSQNPEIFMVYEAIDGMIQEDPAKRIYPNGAAVAEAVAGIVRRLGMGANVVSLNAPQRCIYCGNGYYKSLYSSYLPAMKFSSPFDLGVQLINEQSRRWLFLACDHCGNVQIFRADQAADPTVWG